MEDLKNSKYNRAKKKVDDIKGFYSHLTVYLIVNTAILVFRLVIFRDGLIELEIPEWSMFTTPIFWGFGLLCHGLWVFSDKLRFVKKWEDRKINEYMEEELYEEDEFKYNRWE